MDHCSCDKLLRVGRVYQQVSFLLHIFLFNFTLFCKVNKLLNLSKYFPAEVRSNYQIHLREGIELLLETNLYFKLKTNIMIFIF